MPAKTTTIYGYKVELELYQERGEPRSDCFITKGNFSASLSCLEGTGNLTNHITGNEKAVDEGSITAIADWAIKNGY